MNILITNITRKIGMHASLYLVLLCTGIFNHATAMNPLNETLPQAYSSYSSIDDGSSSDTPRANLELIPDAILVKVGSCSRAKPRPFKSAQNEDAYVIEILPDDTIFLIVCDGHGTGTMDLFGKPLEIRLPGSVARHACQYLLSTIMNQAMFATHLPEAIILGTQELDRVYMDHPFQRQGSTMTCAFVNKEKITIATLGDSPCWIYKHDGSFYRTIDHTPQQEQLRIENEGGEIKNERGTFRTGGIVAVARALGNHGFESDIYYRSHLPNCDYHHHKDYLRDFPGMKLKGLSNHPDIVITAKNEYSFLLIASDGLEKIFIHRECLYSDNLVNMSQFLSHIQENKKNGMPAQENLNAVMTVITDNETTRPVDDTTVILMYLD